MDDDEEEEAASIASRPSLIQENEMGRFPSKTWQDTAERIPSLNKLLGNRNGMIVGGAEIN